MTITYSAKTVDAIAKMTVAVDAAEQARLEGKAYAGKGSLFEDAQNAANEANKAIIEDGIAAFCDIANKSRANFFSAYFKDWTVDGFRVVQDSNDDGGEIHTDSKALRIPFSAIDAKMTVKLVSNGAWRKALKIYGDNIMQFIADNEEGENALSAKTPLSADLMKKRDELGGEWLKHSHSALVQQLNDLVKMVFPAELQPTFRMVSVDQKTLTAHLTRGKKTETNNAATTQMANLNTIEYFFFTQIYTRMNGLAVNLETGFGDKKHADKNAPKAGDAKGGDVKDGSKSAPKKQPVKKSGKKQNGKPVPKEEAVA